MINRDKPLGGYENEKLNKKLNNLKKADVIDNLKKRKRGSIPLAGDLEKLKEEILKEEKLKEEKLKEEKLFHT